MWKSFAVVIASLVSACVVEEPVGEVEGVSWSESGIVSEESGAPEVEAIGRGPRCMDHYVCCQESALGDVWDGWNQSRCDTCQRLCRKNDLWPYYTPGGDDCQWWQEKYGRPSEQCKRLVR